MFCKKYSQGCLERRQVSIERLVELDAIPLETAQVFGFLIRLAILPATPKNAQPLESDHSDCGPTTLAFAQLLLIKQPGPLALADRALGELDDALMIKDGACVAKLNKPLAATFLFDGGHPTETQQILGGLEISANGSESRRQARSQRRTTAGQSLEKPRFGVLREDRFDPQVVLLDGLVEHPQLRHQPFHLQLQGLDQRWILRQRRRLLEALQPLSDSLLRPAVMRV